MTQPPSEYDAALPTPDHRDPGVMAELFTEAAAANERSSLRRGGSVHLPDRGGLLMTGDLHDHGLNFRRVMRLAELAADGANHLVLHELIHGPRMVNGLDLSVRLLSIAAAVKLRYPEQVHFLLSNHELAQVQGKGIWKDSVDVVEAFDEALAFLYAEAADGVRAAIKAFIVSMPLAVRCANGVLCAHSLPSPGRMEAFDPGVIDRALTDADLERGGSAFEMVWGRRHTREVADRLSRAWGAEQFVLGHQPAEMGYETQGENMLILASNHEHGCALPIDLGRRYDMNGLIDQIVPLAGVVMAAGAD